MIATVHVNSRNYKIDLTKPLDVSIAIDGSDNNVNAWYLGPPKIYPHEEKGFKGSVAQGAVINFNDIWFNPHAHGTHTECVGHITEKVHSVKTALKQFFYLAELITVAPEKKGEDMIISKKQVQRALGNKKRSAVLLRTLPNTKEKKKRQYSNTNPPYLLEETAVFLRDKGVEHLLIDLPSIDREKDKGLLLAHNAFWNTKGNIRKNATITEFIYVPNKVEDGTYILNLQVAAFENDASPSRPVLYQPID